MRTETTHGQTEFKRVFASFSKIDEEARMVFGYATTETRDQQGEIVRLSAVEKALPDYMRFANIREMHQPWAVGTAVEADVDGTGFWLGAHIVDEDAWQKVKKKVYKGFSIGGNVTARDPIDRTIISGLELTEVSVVDRPANPDAVFTVVKRNSDGVLQEQPRQYWGCGLAEHQHLAKVEASTCMADRARELQKKASQMTKAALAMNVAADAATVAAEVPPIEKGAALDHTSGRFASHTTLAAGAHKSRAGHERAAAKARDEERAHRGASARALKAGDTDSVTRHEQLASAAASLAGTHDRAAGHYRDLAARHEKATTKEVAPMLEVTAMQKAEEEAQAAIAAVSKVLEEPVVEKREIDHNAEGRKHREDALNHTKDATDHEESAATSRADAREARKAGTPDRANEHEAEAEQHDLAAAGHHQVAESLHEFHGHHVTKAVGADDADHGAIAEHADKAGQEHAARAHAHETKATMHGGMQKSADLSKAGAAHHADMAAKYAGFAGQAKKSAATMAAVHGAATKCVAEKVAKAAAVEAAAAAKVKPVSGLKSTADGWVDVAGASFFGKRERDDAKRKDLALKGLAMPDGAFPIEDKAEVADAIGALAKAVAADAEAVHKHVVRRAIELEAKDSIPEDLKKYVDGVMHEIGEKKTPTSGATAGGAATEAERQAAGLKKAEEEKKAKEEAEKLAAEKAAAAKGVLATGAIDSTVTDKGPIKTPTEMADHAPGKTEAERQAAGRQPDLAAGTVGVAKRLGKGMGIVSRLAQIVAAVEELYQSSEIEAAYEGESDKTVCTAIEAACTALVNALRVAVTHETAEVEEGTDVETYAAAAKASKLADGIARIAKEVRDGAMAKTVTDKRRAVLKRLADALEKAAGIAREEAAKVAPTAKVAGVPEDEVAKRVKDEVEKARAEEQARAATVITQITGSVAGLAKQAGEVRAELERLRKEVKTLGDMPAGAPKGRLTTTAVNKIDEPGATGADRLVKAADGSMVKLDDLPTGERANALIRQQEEARGAEAAERERRMLK